MTGRIVLIVVIQTVLLLAMIGMKQWTLTTGTPILLETQPIDPRSLFRGDYVRLSYSVSDLKISELDGDSVFTHHDRIYVALQAGEKYWQPVSIHHDRPAAPPDGVVLKGEVTSINRRRWNRDRKSSTEGDSLTVRYGIENYFVPEGEGRELERRFDEQGKAREIDIRVAVDRFGNAGIKEILVNGETQYVETLF
jgi:uncharacterized membrane-anchored protein